MGTRRLGLQTLAAALSLAALLAPPARAQEGPAPTPEPAPPAPAPDAAPPADDAKPAQDPKAEPPKKLPKDRVVAVHLKNGNVVQGYALDSRLYEVEESITATVAGTAGVKKQERFVPAANAKVPGVGIRVWYPNNSQGFLFIPYTQIEKVDAGRVLTRKEQDALFAAIRAKEQRLAEAAAKLREENARKDAAAEELRRAIIEEAIAKATGVSVEDARKKRDALLSRFPPGEGAEGWNAARKAAIERKLTILGQIPTADEQEFVKVYKDWAQAKSEAEQLGIKPSAPAAPPAGEAPAADEAPAGGEATPPAGEGTPSGEGGGEGAPPAGGSGGGA